MKCQYQAKLGRCNRSATHWLIRYGERVATLCARHAREFPNTERIRGKK